MKDLNISLLFDYYGECLSDKQREIFDYYYNEDFSLAEVAENLGITRQGVRDFVKRTEQQLLEYEAKLGLHAKTVQLKALCEKAKENPEELPKLFDLIDNF